MDKYLLFSLSHYAEIHFSLLRPEERRQKFMCKSLTKELCHRMISSWYLILSSYIPDSEANILVLYSLHIKTCSIKNEGNRSLCMNSKSNNKELSQIKELKKFLAQSIKPSHIYNEKTIKRNKFYLNFEISCA